jgi:broad specificity phosphatase PhoE
MPTTLLLIRHGESEVNVHDPPMIGGRSTWCELTPRGIEQSRALGRWMREQQVPCDQVVASVAVRAQQTARHCLSEAGIALRRLRTAPELEELSQGDWENHPRSVILTPETVRLIEETHWEFRPPGGESQADVHERAFRWLERELLRSEGGHIWLFCHGVVIKVLLAGIFGLDRRTAWKIAIDNTSLTRLLHGAQGWQLLGQNETPHLSP